MDHTYISLDPRSTTYTNVVDPKMSVKEIKVLMMMQFHVLLGTTLTMLQVFVVR